MKVSVRRPAPRPATGDGRHPETLTIPAAQAMLVASRKRTLGRRHTCGRHVPKPTSGKRANMEPQSAA
jgi:hypothetical protein